MLNHMNNNICGYIWRCAKCSYYFTNITEIDGTLKLEKKCPKCKSVNQITLGKKELFIHCHFFDLKTNGYYEENEEMIEFRQSL